MFHKNNNFEKFENKVWLSSPTMYPTSMRYVQEAYETNWMSTVGANITELEKMICEKVGCKDAVALTNGTSALHMAIKVAGEKIYGKTQLGKGSLNGHKVFCSDITFAASVNPVIYEGGVPVFIDSEYESWNMDPEALEKAFQLYPDVKIIIVVHLYGTPGKMDEIRTIAKEHDAVIIEDAAESLGASYKGIQTGSLGDYNCISFNGNKIITGSSGGIFTTDDAQAADTVRKIATQSKEKAPWYQHEEMGYNYRMSNVIAGVVRDQFDYLDKHIEQKKEIYRRYKEGFKDIPITMNPIPEESESNYWLSCILIDSDAMCQQNRGDYDVSFIPEKGKSCPTEILEAIQSINAEGRPIWKPMHMQPIYKDKEFVTVTKDVEADIFQRGLCLPSDIKMTVEQQDKIIQIVKACFE